MRSVFPLNRCRVLTVAALLIPLLLAAGIGMAGEVRLWTYSPPGGGREREFEAEFVGVKGVIVMLKAKDGKNYEPPLASLSEGDVSYVEKMSRAAQGEFVDWTESGQRTEGPLRGHRRPGGDARHPRRRLAAGPLGPA